MLFWLTSFTLIVPTLFFDIETAPIAGSAFSEALLSPATAHISTLTVYDLEREQGTVYVNSAVVENVIYGDWQLKCMPEDTILREFWEGLDHYDTFVGFGTRTFDTPFITHRSIAFKVKPRAQLRNRRILTQQSLPFHVDLLDQFSFDGSTRKVMSLRDMCTLYEMESVDKIINPADFLAIYLIEDKKQIFEHCRQKALVTSNLYDIWLQNLAPPHFMNTIALS